MRTLLVALVLLAALAPNASAEKERVMLQHIHRIIIDPGHGGENPGCMGFHGVYEKFVTLEIAQKLVARLQATTDAEALLTRAGDEFIGLRERTRFANEKEGDIFLSIHINASPHSSVHGVETYFLSARSASQEIAALVSREQGEVPVTEEDLDIVRGKEIDRILLDMQLGAAHALSETLAASIQRQLVRTLEVHDRGVKQAPFGVLKESSSPAIVIECGFLTHRKEGERLLLESYQEKIAEGIVNGIVAYDTRIHRRTRPKN